MKKPKLARVFWLSVLAPAFGNVSSFGHVGTLSLLSLTVSHLDSVAIAADGRQWEYDPYTNQLQITSKEKPQYFVLASPPRIVIDVPQSSFGKNPTQENYPGLVQSIRISEFKPGETRIVMDLDPAIWVDPGQITLEPLGQGNRWVLRPQITLSQVLPRVESRGTLPQLPPEASIRHQSPILGNQPQSSPESMIMPPLPISTTPLTLPINSEVGLPTQLLPPDNASGDRPVTVNVPSLNQMPPVTRETTETTEIFVPPPPPPDWYSSPTSQTKTPTVIDSSVMTPEEMKLMESLPPYSEWRQIPLTENQKPDFSEQPSLRVETAPTVPPAIESTVAEIPIILPVPATPEWQENTPEQASNPVSANASASNESLSLMNYSFSPDQVITFGESLPKGGNSVNSDRSVTAINVPNVPKPYHADNLNEQHHQNNQNSTAVPVPVTDPNVLVAAGTMMILSYPGEEGFTLKSGSSRREVLLVNMPLYDRNGDVVAPVGTPVIGTFKSDRSGSRFVVESIVINGEMVSIKAESNPIAGDMAVSRNGLLSWSTLGVIGGAALGGLAGGPLLGGAAAGIAANLLTSPTETAIEPGQIFPVRFTEHWRTK